MKPEPFKLRAPVPKEGEISAEIVRFLRVVGVVALRLNVLPLFDDRGEGGVRFYRSAPRGMPDLLCFIPPARLPVPRPAWAVPLLLEVKRPGAPVPRHQARMHEALTRAGCLVAVVRSVAEVRALLHGIGAA